MSEIQKARRKYGPVEPPRTPQIFIGHRYEPVAKSLSSMICKDMTVAGIYTNYRALVRGLRDPQRQPQTVLLDPELNAPNYVSIFAELASEFDKIGFVAVSSLPKSNYETAILEAGARAYLQYPINPQELNHSLSVATKASSPKVITVSDLLPRMNRRDLERVLTPREMDVMMGLAEGLLRDKLAYELKISIKTIDTHRKHINRKIGVQESNNQSDILRYHAARILRPERVFEADKLSSLSDRELEILLSLSEGFGSFLEVADRFSFSDSTIHAHTQRITKKLGLKHRFELISLLPAIASTLRRNGYNGTEEEHSSPKA